MKNSGMLSGLILVLCWPLSVCAFWLEKDQSHWLMGVSAGYAELSGSFQNRLTYRALPNIPLTQTESTLKDEGGLYSFFIGYQERCNRWIKGLEARVDWYDIDQSHTFSFSDPNNFLLWQGTVKHRRGPTPSFSGRLGYALVPYFTPYLRLGGELSHDKMWSEFSTNSPVFPYTLTPHAKTWVYRFLAGIGAEMPIFCTALTFRLEFNYHSKGRTIESDAGYTDGVINPIMAGDFQPKMLSYRFSLVRHFS